jgi:hypothetical protein
VRTGIIYGICNRGFIAIPTRFGDRQPIWIHYLIITASPSTYLTEKAIKALTGPDINDIDRILGFINGEKVVMERSK